MPSSVWACVHVAVFNTLLLLVVTSHGRAMLSDPGIVPLPKTRFDKRPTHNPAKLNTVLLGKFFLKG